MKKTAFVIMLVTILSKVFGFVRDIALSYFYGASTVSDVFLVSQTIPNTLFALIGTAVMMGFIPIASRIYEEKSTEEGDRFTQAMLTSVVLLALVIVVIGMLFTRPIVRIFAIGFDREALDMAVFFTRVFLWGLLANAAIYVLRGYLQVKERYVITTMTGFPYNFVLIAGIALSAWVDLRILPYAAVIALFAQLFLFIPDLVRLRFAPRFTLRFDPQMLRDFLRFVLPVVIAAGIAQAAAVIDRTVASGVAVGGISALNYASRLNGFVLGLFTTSLITVLYPMMSRMAATGNMNKMKDSVNESVLLTSIFIIPVSIGAALLAEPIVSVLFGRGAFDDNALAMTTSALTAYSIGMLPAGLREILSKALYAMEDTKTPLWNGMIASGMHIVLCLLLYRPFGIMGIAIATSIDAILATVMYFVTLRKKIDYGLSRANWISVGKILVAAIGMGVVAYFGYALFSARMGEFLSLSLSILLAAGLYAAALLVLRVDEATQFIHLLRSRFQPKVRE